jgi:aryl-alcohol dehydrogenase-like predicted oxidoreductase
VVQVALDLGINFFDTANVYGATSTFDRPGAPPAAEREPAELILGRALAGRRDDVVIATKSGERRFDPAAGLSRRYIIQQVEHSLHRLGTDYIDLYYAHFPDPDTPLEQTLSVYDDLVRQGKLRYVALSNYPAWQVTHALWIADDRRLAAPVCVQVKYNLIDRAAEAELAPACVQFGLSIVPFRCMADYWPAPPKSRNGSSPGTSVSAGPGSAKQSLRLAAKSSGWPRIGACSRIRFRWPGCCPAQRSGQ